MLSNEVFDSVSGYIIIDKALCGKIITGANYSSRRLQQNFTYILYATIVTVTCIVCGVAVRAQQMKIVGYPVCIEDDKYHRNALLFNIGTRCIFNICV